MNDSFCNVYHIIKTNIINLKHKLNRRNIYFIHLLLFKISLKLTFILFYSLVLGKENCYIEAGSNLLLNGSHAVTRDIDTIKKYEGHVPGTIIGDIAILTVHLYLSLIIVIIFLSFFPIIIFLSFHFTFNWCLNNFLDIIISLL